MTIQEQAKRFVITEGFAECPRCKGTGCLVTERFSGNGVLKSAITCPSCVDRAVELIKEGR